MRSHVDAARLAGVGRTRLALRHLLPGAFPAVLVTASLDVGSLVLILAGLSFIGLGSPAPELGARVLVTDDVARLISADSRGYLSLATLVEGQRGP